MSSRRRLRRVSGASPEINALLAATLLVATFAALRYRGLWGETDTSAFTTAIRAMLAEAQLVPPQFAYPNGYAFPALATFLVRLAGLPPAPLQLSGSALLAVWLVIPAWLAYRQLTGSARAATLATAILLVQPEFLFPILRGSHEKFTRGLIFICLYLLLRSVLSRRQWRRFAAFLLAFYLALYALITFNNLLATSFIVALALALLLNLLVHRLRPARAGEGEAICRRLFYATAVALLLAFAFTFYAYAPARHSILVAESIADRLALLLLGLETEAVNPYQAVAGGWRSLPIYLLVSSANWLLLFISFLLWSTGTFSWWRHRSWPDEPRALLLWSLYGAFGFLGALSIAVDVSGAIAGNLQHRIFPSFAMIAAAVVAGWFVRLRALRPPARRLAYGALAAAIALLALAAAAKASNEPSLSNKWTYYTPAEFAALDWAHEADPQARTWASFDERLPAAVTICCAWESAGRHLDSFRPDPGTRNFLLSDVVRARSRRLGLPLPLAGDGLRVYDNGAAEIYHLRPRSPFQR